MEQKLRTTRYPTWDQFRITRVNMSVENSSSLKTLCSLLHTVTGCELDFLFMKFIQKQTFSNLCLLIRSLEVIDKADVISRENKTQLSAIASNKNDL